MLVHDFLSRSATNSPDVTAIIDRERVVTYAALERRANRVAHVLIQRGVNSGDRVVLAMENCTDWIASYFGILKAGAVAVPVAGGARSDRLPHVMRDCEPAACLIDQAALPSLAAARATNVATLVRGEQVGGNHLALSGPMTALDHAIEASRDDLPPGRRSDRDLAAIIYTSGSTGTPRGVMLSHLNIRSNTESIVEYLGLTSADRMMVVLPLHYVYGLSLLHTHCHVGGSIVLDNRFAFPNVVLQAMQTHEVTGFAGVPSTFAILLHRSVLRRMRLPSLRYVTQAGGGMPQALVREWQEAMPDTPLFVMYGATEASARLAYLDPAELARRPGSIGRPIRGVELRIVREDGALAAPGEVGELVASGPNIMIGYWKQPDESAAVLGPWGYCTGDLARSDADGFFYIIGRKKDMLKVGAHRVGAAEIEEALHQHPAAHQVAVVGAPDDIMGEVPVAFVVAREGHPLSPDAVIDFCRRRLPEYKVPASVIIVGDLPRTETGKVDKNALKRSVGEIGSPATHVRGSAAAH